MELALQIFGIILSAAAAVVGGLVLTYLKQINQRTDSNTASITITSDRVAAVERTILACKIDCQRDTVSKEDWVRGEGYTRQMLKELSASMNRMDGKLDVANKMPEVFANVIRDAIKNNKEGKNNE